MTANLTNRLKQLLRSLELPAPEVALRLARLQSIERNLVLPLKAVAIGIILYSLHLTPWFGMPLGSLEVTVTTINTLFAAYVVINILGAFILLSSNRLSFTLVQWSVFAISLVDAIFIGALTLVSGGYDSPLFWLFVVMIVRNSASTPPLWSQLTLNLCVTACFAAASLVAAGLDAQVEEELYGNPVPQKRPATNLVENTFESAVNQPALSAAAQQPDTIVEDPTEAIFIRWLTLALAAVWLYVVQVLLEKQRLALEEAREFNLRENQLRSAGRLAAEFAHQIKNPLAIVNNAAFSLGRSLKSGKGDPQNHLRIISEEVERADRIITQVMGYAELTEGRVEKLDLTEEIQRAVDAVFPKGLMPSVKVTLKLKGPFPPMLMQRRHLSEVFVNLFQNAREAMNNTGSLSVTGVVRSDLAVQVIVADAGPGIPPDKLPRIFEAYFTTKQRGTGLGLAIVRNNVELYGGTVTAESELGKGTRFTLVFPAKAVPQLHS
jgi:signal transduction histidine kinase